MKIGGKREGIKASLHEIAKMLLDLLDYAKLHEQHKLEHHYHVVDKHGCADRYVHYT